MNLIKRERDWLDPFDTMFDIHSDLNRLLFGSLRGLKDGNLTSWFTPEIEYSDEGDKYVVKAELPGIKKENVDISITGNSLVIKGEKREEKEKKEQEYSHSERRFGAFQRTIDFSDEVDPEKVKATFTDGVLELVVPKSERAKPKQIKVEVK